jgi:uncharacterized protein (DUF1778 family)
MARTAESKQDRLQLRLDARSKHILQRAANYRRKSLSQFVLSTALEEAEKVVRDETVVTLSEPDWNLFYDALVTPPAPNAALRKAYRRYRKSHA